MFHNFIHLTTLLLIPEHTAKSFHWATSPVIRSYQKLKTFYIVYDGVELELEEDGGRFEDIVQCLDLVTMFLFNCGTHTPVGVVDDLQKLLMELKHQKYIFHKQVISAMLMSGTLGLERLDLWQKHILEHYCFIWASTKYWWTSTIVFSLPILKKVDTDTSEFLSDVAGWTKSHISPLVRHTRVETSPSSP